MTEPTITVHSETTLKKIKLLRAASVAVWLVSVAMALTGMNTAVPGEPNGLIITSVFVWLASLVMLVVARAQKWWHHD